MYDGLQLFPLQFNWVNKSQILMWSQCVRKNIDVNIDLAKKHQFTKHEVVVFSIENSIIFSCRRPHYTLSSLSFPFPFWESVTSGHWSGQKHTPFLWSEQVRGLLKTEKQKMYTMKSVCILKGSFYQRKILVFNFLAKSKALLDLQIIWNGTSVAMNECGIMKQTTGWVFCC